MLHARPDYQRIQDPENKIPANEPVFLLRGQDFFAPIALRYYADILRRKAAGLETQGKHTQAHDLMVMAVTTEIHANKMDVWQRDGVCKIPDLATDPENEIKQPPSTPQKVTGTVQDTTNGQMTVTFYGLMPGKTYEIAVSEFKRTTPPLSAFITKGKDPRDRFGADVVSTMGNATVCATCRGTGTIAHHGGEYAEDTDEICPACKGAKTISGQFASGGMGFPRRNQTLRWSPGEKAIQNAVDVVEHMGASIHLTDAVILLSKARDKVADFVDGIPVPKARQDHAEDQPDGCASGDTMPAPGSLRFVDSAAQLDMEDRHGHPQRSDEQKRLDAAFNHMVEELGHARKNPQPIKGAPTTVDPFQNADNMMAFLSVFRPVTIPERVIIELLQQRAQDFGEILARFIPASKDRTTALHHLRTALWLASEATLNHGSY